MRKGIVRFLLQFVIIAALYAIVSIIQNYTVGMSGRDQVQIRLAEALTVLPVFTPAAIPGLFAGSLISNYFILGISAKPFVYHLVAGSLATLAAAALTFLVRKKKFLAPVPPIVINMVVIPFLFTYVYRFEDRPLWQYVIFIGVGELISCGILGIALMLALEDHKDKLFPSGKKEKEDEAAAESGNINETGDQTNV